MHLPWLKLPHRKPHAIVREKVLESGNTPFAWIVYCRCGWNVRADYLMDARELWDKHASSL